MSLLGMCGHRFGRNVVPLLLMRYLYRALARLKRSALFLGELVLLHRRSLTPALRGSVDLTRFLGCADLTRFLRWIRQAWLLRLQLRWRLLMILVLRWRMLLSDGRRRLR